MTKYIVWNQIEILVNTDQQKENERKRIPKKNRTDSTVLSIKISLVKGKERQRKHMM